MARYGAWSQEWPGWWQRQQGAAPGPGGCGKCRQRSAGLMCRAQLWEKLMRRPVLGSICLSAPLCGAEANKRRAGCSLRWKVPGEQPVTTSHPGASSVPDSRATPTYCLPQLPCPVPSVLLTRVPSPMLPGGQCPSSSPLVTACALESKSVLHDWDPFSGPHGVHPLPP